MTEDGRFPSGEFVAHARARTQCWRRVKLSMAKSLITRFGKIKKLGWNPRNITKVAFSNLCESIYRDPDFMVARPIIIDENNDILGGNQRYTALQELHSQLNEMGGEVAGDWKKIKAGEIPDNWVQQVIGWDDEKKKRFNLIDNSPAGIAGTFDYDILKQEFGIDIITASGIDVSEMMDSQELGDFTKSLAQKAEESEYGEQSEENQMFEDYKAAKQESKDLIADNEAVHYICTFVFQSLEQKNDFLKKSGISAEYGLFANGLELAEKMGIKLIDAPTHVLVPRKPETRLKDLAMEIPKHEEEDDEKTPPIPL